MYTQSKLKKQNQKKKLIRIFASGVIATLLLALFPIISQVQAEDYARHDIDSDFTGVSLVYPADIDGDHDMDVIAASWASGKIVWWQNKDGWGTDWSDPEEIITDDFKNVKSVYAVDLDNDNDKDVLGAAQTAGNKEIAWWENKGGTWTKHSLITGINGYGVYAADIVADDSGQVDNYKDIVGVNNTVPGSGGKIILWKNNGDGTFDVYKELSVSQARWVHSADIDNDGYLDIVASYFGGIKWWENPGGAGNWTSHKVTDLTAAWVYSEYLNDDEHMDVIAIKGGKPVWWANDGLGNFGPKQSIDPAFDGARSVYSKDIDGDGDMDVLVPSGSQGLKEIAWWENPSWTKHTVVKNLGNASSAYTVDIDGDGHMDVVGADQDSNDIAWWEIEKEDLGSGGSHMYGVVVGNGDNDPSGKNKVYATNSDNNVYQFERDDISLEWGKTVIESVPGPEGIALGNGDNDPSGDNKIYVAGSDYKVYELRWNSGTSDWDKTDIGGAGERMREVVVGDGDGDGSTEVYATCSDGHVYQFTCNGGVWDPPVDMGNVGDEHQAWGIDLGDADKDGLDEVYVANWGGKCIYRFKYNGGSWEKLEIGCGGDSMFQIALGDVESDGETEIYGTNLDNKVYRFKCTQATCDTTGDWSSTEISSGPRNMMAVEVGNGDNDGNPEVYATDSDWSKDGHVYQIKCTGDCDQTTGWETEDMGLQEICESDLQDSFSITVGDGDNDGQFEVYTANRNHHVYQYHVLTKHGAKGLSAGFSPVLSDREYINVSEIYQLGLKDILIKDATGDKVATFRVNFSQECDWSSMPIGKLGFKAYIDTSGQSSILGPVDLYVPSGGSDEVVVCEGATDLLMIGETCYIDYGPGKGPVTAKYKLKVGGTPTEVEGSPAGTPHLIKKGNDLVLVDVKGTGVETLGGEEEGEVPEFTTVTLIIAAVAGFGIYLLIRKKNSPKKPKEA